MAQPAAALRVRLTGFGRFQGVDDNPTTHLVRELGPLIEESPLKGLVRLEHSDVLEVSGLACVRYLKERGEAEEADVPLLYLHLGVAASRKAICLEDTAHNETDFGCPDERGWMPINQQISNNDVTQLRCKLQLGPIAQQLSEMFPVEVSHDPGNYIYYRSLMASNPKRYALFVHVPPFSVCPKDMQLLFLVSLLEKLREALLLTAGDTPAT